MSRRGSILFQMIVYFDCKPHVKDALDALVSGGRYRDYGEVISVAVLNLRVVEDAAAAGPVVVAGPGSITAAAPQVAPANEGTSSRVVSVPPLFGIHDLPR